MMFYRHKGAPPRIRATNLVLCGNCVTPAFARKRRHWGAWVEIPASELAQCAKCGAVEMSDGRNLP